MTEFYVAERQEKLRCSKPWTKKVASLEEAYKVIAQCYEEDKAYDQYTPNLYQINIFEDTGYKIIKVEG